ncbi:putative disease resistance protein At3g14460 [Actinidia eriantha]|uniref:putative disease resistance protein At3g14460 n=1 Tax=Actinidia eriantha TaxID=165200 RepID=UPI00258E5AE8|nr:putative disease resistance protein At3g14460 [Actinidia eriantha]
MGNLINLRHLDITGAYSLQEMPSKMGKLTNLQTLSNYIISKGDAPMIRELGTLIHLRGTLCISGLENVVDVADAIGANLHDKQGIDVLSMKWRWSNSSDDSRNERVELGVLEMLQPNKNLKRLTIRSYHGLEFPTWIVKNALAYHLWGYYHLPRLKTLEIRECPELVVERLPSPTMPHGMRNTLLFDSLTSLSLYDVSIPCSFNSPEVADEACSPSSSLTSMHLENIQELTCLPSWFFQGMMGLEELKIVRCQNLSVLWQNDVRLQHLGLPSTLRTLRIDGCDSLQSFPELMMLNNLEELTVMNCSTLMCLCPGAGLPSTLKKLFIYRCEKLEAVLAEGMTINCPSLESIDIRFCDNFKTLPDVIQNHDLRNLNMLDISYCDNLKSLPEGWFLTTNLRELGIRGCKKLDTPPQSAYNKNNHLTSLQRLVISSSPAAAGIASYVLKEGRSLTNLTNLTISNIDKPPSEWGLHRLASLRELRLEDSNCVSFPEDGFSLPTSLISLRIARFPNLEKLSSKN